MRGSSLDAGRRAYLGVARGTVDAVDDTPKMQTMNVRLAQNEMLTSVERLHHYGFSSVPRPPDGTGGDAKAAEVVVAFINGNRSHPLAIAVDDRRYRPTNWQQGDSGLWHYSGHTARFTDNGWEQNHADNKPWSMTVGNANVTIANGKITAKVGGTSVVITDGKISLGGENASHAVMLDSGPSSLVFATR